LRRSSPPAPRLFTSKGFVIYLLKQVWKASGFCC
jgi:hypothetical protein